jgi:hypothetical protein
LNKREPDEFAPGAKMEFKPRERTRIGGYVKSVPESKMAFPDIPGIIEGAMTITPENNGRISFRVLISANSERAGCCDRIQLIIDSEYVRKALAAPKTRRRGGEQPVDELPTFPCHVGFKPQ